MGSLLTLAAGLSSASAGTVTFYFGDIGFGSTYPVSSSNTKCSGECVINLNGEVYFTVSGVSVGATG